MGNEEESEKTKGNYAGKEKVTKIEKVETKRKKQKLARMGYLPLIYL